MCWELILIWFVLISCFGDDEKLGFIFNIFFSFFSSGLLVYLVLCSFQRAKFVYPDMTNTLYNCCFYSFNSHKICLNISLTNLTNHFSINLSISTQWHTFSMIKTIPCPCSSLLWRWVSQNGWRWKRLWEVIWSNFPLIGELLQSLHCLCVHSLESLQYLHTFLVLGNP